MSWLWELAMAALLALGIGLGGLALIVLLGVCVTSLVCSFFPEGDGHE